MSLSLFVLLGLASGGAPQAAGPPVFRPTGKWILEYADTMCIATRTYTDGDRQVTVGFSPVDLRGSMLDLVWQTEDRQRTGAHQYKGAVEIDGRTRDVDIVTQWSDKIGQLNRASLYGGQAVMAAQRITLPIVRGAPVNIPETDFAAVKTALATCQRDLLESFGADLATFDRVDRHARPIDIERWFAPAHYPREMLRKNQQANVRILIHVDAQGKPTQCEPVGVIGDRSFANASCGVAVRHGRYEAATDASGAAVPGYHMTRIQWRVGGW